MQDDPSFKLHDDCSGDNVDDTPSPNSQVNKSKPSSIPQKKRQMLSILSPVSKSNLIHLKKTQRNAANNNNNVFDIMAQMQSAVSDIDDRNKSRMELKAAEIDVMKSRIELEKEAKTEELKIMRERIELDKDVMKSHAASEVKKLMAEMETIELDNNKKLLLSRMELREKGVPQDEIDLVLPLKKD